MRKTLEAIESGDIFDVFKNAIRGQKAFSQMLYLLHRAGDSLDEEEIQGISWILDQQAELLEDIYYAVETKQMLIDDYSDQIEKQIKQSEQDSEKVTGLRRQLIADAMGRGAEAGDIAAAVNMRKASIEKVIRQLQGESPVPQAKAVNG